MAAKRPGRIRRWLVLGVVPAALLLSSIQRAEATPISVESFSVARDLQTQTVTFAFTFDRVPDFRTYDAVGRQADSFWIDILNNPGPRPMLSGFGGEDIRILGDYGPSHSGFFAITNPRSAGSPLLSLVPYQLAGATLSFSTSFAQIAETDGEFEAVMHTTQYGSANIDPVRLSGPAVPEVGAFTAFSVGLSLLALNRSRSRARC